MSLPVHRMNSLHLCVCIFASAQSIGEPVFRGGGLALPLKPASAPCLGAEPWEFKGEGDRWGPACSMLSDWVGVNSPYSWVSAGSGGNKEEDLTPAGAEVKPELSHREVWELAERVWGSASGAV